jgi:hypothetical protein
MSYCAWLIISFDPYNSMKVRGGIYFIPFYSKRIQTGQDLSLAGPQLVRGGLGVHLP